MHSDKFARLSDVLFLAAMKAHELCDAMEEDGKREQAKALAGQLDGIANDYNALAVDLSRSTPGDGDTDRQTELTSVHEPHQNA